MRMTNEYVQLCETKSGTQYESLPVWADNREAAARLLHCAVDDVRFKKQVRRTELQRHGDHAAKMPVHMWAKRVWLPRRTAAVVVVARKAPATGGK